MSPLLIRATAVALVLLSLLSVGGGPVDAQEPPPPPGPSVDLRVLVVSIGDRAADPGLDLMVRTLDQFGVPYEVIDSSTTELTDAVLRDAAVANRGRYNGVILTQANLPARPSGGEREELPGDSGFTLEEWQRLHQYERDFDVRESVVAGFPAFDPGHDLDYGMGVVSAQATTVGRWVAPAGTGRLFSYVNTANTLDIPEFSFWGQPRTDNSAPQVTPLLVDDQAPTNVLVSKLDYADGREVLLSTIGNAWFRLHSNVLAYQFLDFATKGVFLGGRFVSLSTHTDDMFLADDLWDPATNQTDFTKSYRLTAADVDNVVASQNAFRAAHPLAATWRVQFPFNGIGAQSWTPMPRVSRQIPADSMLVASNLFNYGNSTSITVARGPNMERRLVLRAADLSAPAGSGRVDRVALRLTVNSGGPLAVDICPINQRWVEGSGRGGLLDIVNVSWANRDGLTRWQTAGGTHDTAACVRQQISGPGAQELDITSIWRLWSAGRANNGVLIKAAANGSATITSAEGTAANRPTMLIDASTPPEPLTAKVLETAQQFGWINHTYAALQMDRLCPDPDEPQPAECPVTDYPTASGEIAQNRVVWQNLGLPGYQDGLTYLLSDSHAGLHDRRGTEEDPSDDIPFPQGSNPNFLAAARDLGVRYVASDSSRPNQDREQRIPGFEEMVLMPRYPTNIFVNATTPLENVDEYNWIYHERYMAQGQDPCTIPGAICAPRTYEQMLDAEADITVSHMLSGKAWPHYFHQSNLRNYSGGRSLQFDWMDAVLTRYERYFRLPVKTPLAHELGPDALDRIVTSEQNVRGWLDLTTGVVTLVADGDARPLVTGLAGGEQYGGQSIGKVTVGTTPRTFSLD